VPSIVLIGSDTALLEGLSQTLAAAGFRVRLADSLHDALVVPEVDPPLIVVVERTAALHALRGVSLPRLSLAPGGSLVLYHATDDGPEPLPASLQRLTLADLSLPLERQRLVALIQSVAARARTIGRGDVTPGEIRR
jgi:hypothetical protein